MKLVSETLENTLKPKSQKDIKKGMKEKSPNGLINMARRGKWFTDMILGAIKRGATNLGNGHNDLIQQAAVRNDTIVIKALLKSVQVDPVENTADGYRYGRDETNWPFRIAARRGHLKIIKILAKDSRVDPSSHDNFALRWSVHDGYYDVAKFLLTIPKVRNSMHSAEYNIIKKLLNRIDENR